MTDFILTNDGTANPADGSPSGCSFCGSVEPPFIRVANFRVAPMGPFKEGRQVQICAPKSDGDTVIRQGCLGTMANQAGYVGPEVLAGAQRDLVAAADTQRELETEIQRLSDTQVNVVRVDDLMELVEASKPKG